MNIDFKELFDVTIRAVSSLVTLFLVTKMLGKKQVSQLSLFDYVIGISIGNFAAEMTINLESHELNGIWAVVLFGLFAYLISWLTMKSIVLRRFFMGTPTILIQDGKILESNLRKMKFDINDMLEEIRSAGYFDLSQVEYASLESARDVEKQNIEASYNSKISEFTSTYDAKVKSIIARFDEENKTTDKQYKQKIGLL